jgi:hypothetical protein
MTTDTQTPVRELLATDRCDKCGAAAMVRVTLLNGELLFCGHHGREFREGLQKASVDIYDPTNSMGVWA